MDAVVGRVGSWRRRQRRRWRDLCVVLPAALRGLFALRRAHGGGRLRRVLLVLVNRFAVVYWVGVVVRSSLVFRIGLLVFVGRLRSWICSHCSVLGVLRLRKVVYGDCGVSVEM
jgi:hypothetical protein